MKKVGLLFAGLIISVQVFACSCLGTDTLTQEEYQQATDIFIGEVVKVDTLKDEHRIAVTLKVKTTLKGEQTEEITVTTPISSAACGVNMSEGDSWYVFGSRFNGKLRVTSCGRHTNLTKPGCKWFAKDKEAHGYKKQQYKVNKARIKYERELIEEMKEVSES